MVVIEARNDRRKKCARILEGRPVPIKVVERRLSHARVMAVLTCLIALNRKETCHLNQMHYLTLSPALTSSRLPLLTWHFDLQHVPNSTSWPSHTHGICRAAVRHLWRLNLHPHPSKSASVPPTDNHIDL